MYKLLDVKGGVIPVEVITFSDGCKNFCIDPELIRDKRITIDIKEYNPSLLEDLAMLRSILTRYGCAHTHLLLRYVPHARADRAFVHGQTSPLQVFGSMLTCIGFNSVTVDDVHSDAAKIALPTCTKFYSHLECFRNTVHNKDFDIVVAPDKGAVAKSSSVAEYLGKPILFADKVRDVATGRITSMELEGDVEGKHCLITDDLSDAAGTHIWLADILKEKGASKVSLYVTHGIFSKGLDIAKGKIDTIYVNNVVGSYLKHNELLEFNN